MAAVWLAVSVGLRWQLGFATYDPWQVRQNWAFLGLLPAPYDPYYRAFAWFVVVLVAPLLVLVASTWRIQTRFSQVASAVVVPTFLVVGFLFSSIVESRIFTPLLPLLAPGAVAALCPRRQ
jgi:hypothetical protein